MVLPGAVSLGDEAGGPAGTLDGGPAGTDAGGPPRFCPAWLLPPDAASETAAPFSTPLNVGSLAIEEIVAPFPDPVSGPAPEPA
ncbi:MAG TPA: hypothetical protein VM263_09495, partial [Acidimicrobiales bacterium]|nr:hypothetical protein [Acidimicrobiales bacterium]